MSYLIREIPIEERPRERLKRFGVSSLSDEELLSIILRIGTKNKSVRDLSMDLLKNYKLSDFNNMNYKSLRNIKGIGEVKALTLLATLEFGKRVIYSKDKKDVIRSSDDIYLNVRSELEDLLQEKFMAIYVDSKLQILSKQILFVGTVNESMVNPRDIFREAVKLNATYIFICHNHPSGNINPSKEDIYLTEKLIELGKKLEIPVIDHLIIGKNNYYSFKDEESDMFEKV